MHPALYWCYAVESLVIKSRCRQPAQLPVAHRAFYHTCCFERISVIFVFVLFFLWFYFSSCWFPSSFLYPEPPSESLKLRIEMVERNVCVFQLHDSIQTIHFYLSMNVILKDNDPIHIFNCLNTCKCLCVLILLILLHYRVLKLWLYTRSLCI